MLRALWFLLTTRLMGGFGLVALFELVRRRPIGPLAVWLSGGVALLVAYLVLLVIADTRFGTEIDDETRRSTMGLTLSTFIAIDLPLSYLLRSLGLYGVVSLAPVYMAISLLFGAASLIMWLRDIRERPLRR